MVILTHRKVANQVSIDAEQLRKDIVRPAIEKIGLWSQEAEDLLIGTAAQESHLGTYLRQLGDGPALGIFQMEPATHNDIHENFLRYKHDLRNRVDDFFLPVNSVDFQDERNRHSEC